MIKKLITNLVKNSSNSIYFEKKDLNNISKSEIYSKVNNCLVSSSISIDNAVPSLCYFMITIDDNIYYHKKYPSSTKDSDFYNNIFTELYQIIEYYQQLKYFINNLNDINTISSTIISDIYIKYKYFLNASYIKTNQKNIDDKYVSDLIEGLEKNYINDVFELDDFYNAINEIERLEEICIFFPFKYDHNILLDKFYLFEINHLKFSRKTTNLKNFTADFYAAYNLYPSEYTLDKIFYKSSNEFLYLDTIDNFNKYKKLFNELEKNIIINKQNFTYFINDFFKELNYIQYDTVKFQHENLVGTMNTNRSKLRTLSLLEILENFKNDLNSYPINEKNKDYLVIQRFIVDKFLQAIKDGLSFSKNTTLEELGFKKILIEPTEKYIDHYNYHNYIYSQADKLLRHFKEIKNFDCKSSLKYIFDKSKNKIDIILKKYRISKKNQKLIYNMLLDIILFNDTLGCSLTKPYNNIIANYINKYFNNEDVVSYGKKRNIEDIIQLNKLQDFLIKYQ